MEKKKLIWSIVLVLLCVGVGFLAGGFLGGRVFSSGMGFDRLADALGGAMVGTVSGLVIGILLRSKLSDQQSMVVSAVLAGLIALFVLAVRFLA